MVLTFLLKHMEAEVIIMNFTLVTNPPILLSIHMFYTFFEFTFFQICQDKLRSQISDLKVSANQKRIQKQDKEKVLNQKNVALRQCVDRWSFNQE